MLKTLLMAGAMAFAFASPATAAIEAFLAADNINQNPVSSQNPLPVATLTYNGTPLGFQQITPTTAVTLSAPAGSRFCYILAEVAPIRWRDDPTAPTGTVGFLIPTNTQVTVTNLAAFKIINSSSGAATVDVSCYK